MRIASRLPLIFIGMPGAGKSYWAQRLSVAWGGAASDLDAEIARISGKSIREIFAAEGEAGFRKRESEALQSVLALKEIHFLATGGGTPCYADNLEKMKNAGTVVYLHAPLPLLAQRIQAQEDIRPLLAGFPEKELLEKLSAMLAVREPFYRQAHYTLSAADDLSTVTFAPL